MRWILLTLTVLLLAGCAGPAKPASTSRPEVVKVDAFGSADTSDAGEIAGRVLDEEFRPLADVRVRILATQAETKTTQDGVFYFPRVPPRSYTLSLSKPGYESKNQSLVVAALQRVVVETLMRQVADQTPFMDDGFLFRGHINCSLRVNTSGTNTNPECGQYDSERDVQRQRMLELLPDVGHVLVEVAWTPSVPGTNERLTLAIRPYAGQSWRQIQGANPIRFMIQPADWSSIQRMSEKDYPRYGGQLQLMMFPGEAVSQGGVAVGATLYQDFTVYATAWYRMEPREGYSRLPPS